MFVCVHSWWLIGYVRAAGSEDRLIPHRCVVDGMSHWTKQQRQQHVLEAATAFMKAMLAIDVEDKGFDYLNGVATSVCVCAALARSATPGVHSLRMFLPGFLPVLCLPSCSCVVFVPEHHCRASKQVDFKHWESPYERQAQECTRCIGAATSGGFIQISTLRICKPP